MTERPMKLREFLFVGFAPCSDGNCIIGGKAKGIQTNGGCRCIENLSRSQLIILAGRIRRIGEIEIEIDIEKPKQ